MKTKQKKGKYHGIIQGRLYFCLLRTANHVGNKYAKSAKNGCFVFVYWIRVSKPKLETKEELPVCTFQGLRSMFSRRNEEKAFPCCF